MDKQDTSSTSSTTGTDAVNAASGATQSNSNDIDVDDIAQSQPLSLKEQMELVMRASMSHPTLPTSSMANAKTVEKSLLAAIKTEMSVFETSGVRGRCLQLVYSYLLAIPPTSIEAEHAFSAAGLLCTKVRSRLGDDTLDKLCFLRTFYRSRKSQSGKSPLLANE